MIEKAYNEEMQAAARMAAATGSDDLWDEVERLILADPEMTPQVEPRQLTEK